MHSYYHIAGRRGPRAGTGNCRSVSTGCAGGRSLFFCYNSGMERNPQFREEYLEQWPKRYYELPAAERLCALQEVLKRDPDSSEDQRRLTLYHMRYEQPGKDGFLHAWMMLKSAEVSAPGFFLKKKYERDVRKEFSRLGITGDAPDALLMDEWRNFADTMIRMYLSSPSYRSAVFGMGAVNDRNTALRLASEIEAVTKTVPELASLGELVTPFRNIVLERFAALVPDGEAILAEVQSR